MKTCNKCKISKDYSCFNKKSKSKDGYRGECKDCRKAETLKYRSSNPEKIKFNNDKFYIIRKDDNKKYHSLWREKNREKLREYQKELYRKNINVNRDKRNIYVRTKRESDPIYKLSQSVRCRIKMFLKSKNIKSNTSELVGCDFITLKNHLEKQFVSGMNWDNHGKWHIDHIKPLCSAKTEQEVYELCHYTNLQPLWAIDNLIKGKVY